MRNGECIVTSYVGTHPSGRRYYAKSKTGRPLAFVVFVHRHPTSTFPFERDRWERVATIEDRPYPAEHHRVDGHYEPYPGDMPPRVKAEESAKWWCDVGNCAAEDVKIVELRVADGSVAKVTP
jgi:hypothetical protein